MLSDITDILRTLKDAEAYLVERGVPNARRNAEWMLGHVLDCRSPDLYLNPYRVIDRRDLDAFHALVARRGARQPLQYILGSTEFMSLPFRMKPGVFIPRPDTEVLLEVVENRLGWEPLDASSGRAARILDLCCGAGVIGISLLHRHRRAECVAVDLSPQAVALAGTNAAKNGVEARYRCLEADALEFARSSGERFDLIVCNPPYVPSAEIEKLLPEIKDHEPRIALDGGPDGLDFYRQLIPALPGIARAPAWVTLEIGDSQGTAVKALLEENGLVEAAIQRDYAGLERVAAARVPS